MSSSHQSTARLINVDLLRVIAMLMVIVLHTILNFTVRPDFFATPIYFLLEPIVALSKTCVLLFFMLSGYLVIQKERSLQNNLNHTLKRIGTPLLFFTLINIYYAVSRGSSLNEELLHLLSFPSSFLWFLEVLLFLYLFNPFWHKLFNTQTKPSIARYLTILTLIFSLLTGVFHFPTNVFTAWNGFVFFYLYGGLVRNKWIHYELLSFNLLLLLGGLLLTLIGDYYTGWLAANQKTSILFDYSGRYQSIPIVMMSIGIFNLGVSSKMQWMNEKHRQIIEWLAYLSFGIYLIHSYVVSLFIDIIGFDFNTAGLNPYLFNVVNVSLVVGISIVIVYLIKKTPVLRAVIGG